MAQRVSDLNVLVAQTGVNPNVRESALVAMVAQTGVNPNVRVSDIIVMHAESIEIKTILETPDVATFVGYPGTFGKVGDLTVTEAPDALAAVGFQPASGRWSTFEAQDVFSAFVKLPLVAALAATEHPDVFHGTGIGLGEDGTWVSTEVPDIADMTGTVPITGSMAATETADRFLALGAGVTRVRRRRTLIIT